MILDKIIEAINSNLKTKTLTGKEFQKGAFYGLAKQVGVVSEDEKRTITPMIYDINGKEINVTADDVYPFQIYHRCDSSNQKAMISQFGDGVKTWSSTFNMIAVVYADPAKIKITQEDLAILIQSGLPTEIISKNKSELPINKANVSLVSHSNNSFTVYSGEYLGAACPLDPKSIYFSVRYSIEILIDRSCISCLNC